MEIAIGRILQWRPRRVDGHESSPLTFTIGRVSLEEVIERREPWVIGRRGKMHYYVLDGMGGADGSHMAGTVKSRCIETLLGGREGERSVERAMEIASGMVHEEAAGGIIPYIVAHDVAGNGPLSMLMEDKEIEEIIVNSPRSNIALYHSRHGFCQTNLKFNDEGSFRFTINRLIAGTEKELNSAYPIIDARMEDGARIHAQIGPYAVAGAAASIRLRGKRRRGMADLIREGSIDPLSAAYLWLAIEGRFNIMIAGAPSTGKTTMLNALTDFSPPEQRIIAVEDGASELRFGEGKPNALSLESRGGNVSLKEQVINSLHMRPERIIVGEIRGEEAREVFFGANIGVPFMATMHTNGDGNALIRRLSSKPMSVEREAICMLDLALFNG